MPAADPDRNPSLTAFDYRPRTRLVFGLNSVARVGELTRDLGVGKVLLVTDAGIVKAGHARQVREALEVAGVSVVCYDDVEENPTTACVDRCLAVARRAQVDGLIGLGGGSSMDTAKGCNFLLTNGGRMQDYWGVGKAALPMLPLVAIPTTAGTGSECQSFALITDEKTHQKMACGDAKAAARVAILDPALTISQPPRVSACTGIDAIAHAVETAVTRRRTPLSQAFSREAFHLAFPALHRVLASPDDLAARAAMQLGAAWAGMAIENSMLGAAHSAANPLTARFGLAHGHAVGLMLPQVIRFNSNDPAVALLYAELTGAPGANSTSAQKIASELADSLQQLLALTGLPPSLSDAGVSPEHLPALAQEAATQWTAQFNPRPVTATDFQEIYARALR